MRNSAEEQITKLRNEARESGQFKTARIEVNGRECTVTAKPERYGFLWLFRRTRVTIIPTGLGSRECVKVEFIHKNGREIAKGLEVFNFPQQWEQRWQNTQKPIPIAKVNGMLKEVTDFVAQNDNLSMESLDILIDKLTEFGNAPDIARDPKDESCSLVKFNEDYHLVYDIDFAIEDLRMRRDAKLSGQIVGKPARRFLGKGCFNSVSLVQTRNGNRAVKPFVKSPKSDEITRMVGTPDRAYARNLAASKLEDSIVELGRNMGIKVPHTIVSVSSAVVDGKPCIAMEYVQGQTASQVARGGKLVRKISNNKELRNEFIRREMWMQLMDVLTGQIDRHGSNVMITPDGFPVAIDHDLSFITKPPRDFADEIPDKLAEIRGINGQNIWGAVDGKSKRNYAMPPVIDREMYEVFVALNLGKLETTLRECGLSKREIDATISRATKLKNLVIEYGEQGRVIEPDQWHLKKWNLNGVEFELTTKNSYARRHLAFL